MALTISECKKEIEKIEDAKEYVNAAIKDYEDANEELEKIKGIKRCEEIGEEISEKIEELEDLLTKMDEDIDFYNKEIERLRKLQNASTSTSTSTSTTTSSSTSSSTTDVKPKVPSKNITTTFLS